MLSCSGNVDMAVECFERACLELIWDGCCQPDSAPHIHQPACGLKIKHRDLRLQQRGLHPLPHLFSRPSKASSTPCAAKPPAVRSAIGMPTRIGPSPGVPVIDINPPIPWAIWSRPGRVASSILAKAGDRCIDDAWIDGPDRFIVETKAEFYVRPIVLHNHIGAACEV